MIKAHAFDDNFAIRRRLLAAMQEHLAAADTLDAIIAEIRSAARAVTSSDGVTFVLRDGDNCYYVEEDAIGPLWKGQRFPMSNCISGWRMRTGRAAVIEDIYADARIPHDVYRRTFVKSLVMVPVGGDSPVAAIGAYWAHRRSFATEEVALIEELAASVANAMAMARRMQEPCS